MKKQYVDVQVKVVFLNTADIITLSSVLEPDYLNQEVENNGIQNEQIGKIN